MNYRVIDMDTYYRKDVFRHFSQDCRASTSITHRVDVTELITFSKRTGTKFYVNFLYVLAKTMNSREDYRLSWDWKNNRLIAYDRINPTQYIFHDDTETFTIAYTVYDPDYQTFYRNAMADIERAKGTREYGLDQAGHPNWFDASCIPWISYDALHVELPDGHLYFNPIINWGRYQEENGRQMMPVTVRLNHAAADGYLVAKVFLQLGQEMEQLCAK
ncbi:MAG: chloramphenicol acetyltransferase [Clostridiales bacterium]|nr:chloramphenicol acetyltransferase [Clostridiales bacterium]